MTADSSSELREKLADLVVGIQVSTHYADHDDKILDNQAEMHIADILALIAQDRQELLKRIEGLLPEYKQAEGYETDDAVEHDCPVCQNNAIKSVRAIINAIRESI